VIGPLKGPRVAADALELGDMVFSGASVALVLQARDTVRGREVLVEVYGVGWDGPWRTWRSASVLRRDFTTRWCVI